MLKLPLERESLIWNRWSEPKDFFAISNGQYNENDVKMFCAHEMSEGISQGVTSNRPGAAGGLLQLNEESYSHTKVTQQPTSLKLAASSKGVAMSNNVIQSTPRSFFFLPPLTLPSASL